MSAADELVQLEQRVGEAQRRVQALGRDLAELGAKVSELKQARVGAYADEDEPKAARLSKKVADLQAKQEELDERRAGAELAARRAADERQSFVAKRYADLVAELEPQAKEAAQAIDALSEQLLAALKAWQDVSGKVSALGHTAGINTRVAGLGWDELSRELRRRPQPTPLPLPGPRATASIVAHDDPDEAVREPARSEIRAKSAKGA